MIFVILFIMLSPCCAGIAAQLKMSLIWPYKGLLLASPSMGTEFYFTCIFCPTARKRAIYVLLVANSFIKTSTCSSLRSMLKAKAFTGCLHRQSRWFPYPKRTAQRQGEKPIRCAVQCLLIRSCQRLCCSAICQPVTSCSARGRSRSALWCNPRRG